MLIEPSFAIDKYQYVENHTRTVGFNRVYAPNGKYFDLTSDEVK